MPAIRWYFSHPIWRLTAPAGYIDAWLEVAQPKGWSAKDTKRLKQRFADFNASPI